MSEVSSFDIKQFHDLLLTGLRTAFQTLQERYAQETIYFYALCLQADFSNMAAGIKTVEQLEQIVNDFGRVVRKRKKSATINEIRRLLQYDVPQICLDQQSNSHFEQAHRMLAAFGEAFWQDENLTFREDETGIPELVSPYQETDNAIMQTIHSTLQELDAEGLFGLGDAREQVVIDVMWFEGGMSQSVPYLMGIDDIPPMPLNPPHIQEQYHKILADGIKISRHLFDS